MKLIPHIILLHLLILVLCHFSYAQVIPPERQVNWSIALESYQYEVPATELNVKDFGAKGDGINDDQPAIMEAIAALGGGLGYIYFPEGKYLLRNSIALPDSAVLRGDGASLTELLFDLDQKNKNCISIDKSQQSKSISLDGGYMKESTKVFSDSSNLFNESDYALIFEENGEWDDKPINWAENAVGQIVQIDSIAADTLYLKWPLRISYQNDLNPKIKRITPVANAGVSCLKVKRLDKPETGGGANIFLRYAANCFVRGVESDTSAGSHIDISGSTGILIDGCYIHHAFDYDGASKHGYGITLNNQTGECLITNNIFEHLRHAMMVKTGANGNVFSYNYSIDVTRSEWPNNYGGDISLHGHYPYANLFEGNIVQNIITDHYWGPSGPLNTFFRNRAELYGIIMTGGDPTTSDAQNYVGNEITNDFLFYGQYMLTGSDHFEYGNNRLGTIIPEGTDTLSDVSYYLGEPPVFWDISDNWPSIGIPHDLDAGSIPAKQRHSSSENLTVCPDTAISHLPPEKKLNQGFRLWPNPASNHVNISFDESSSGGIQVALHSTDGRIIFKTKSVKGQLQLSLDTVSRSGLYIVSILSDHGTQIKKLLVIK